MVQPNVKRRFSAEGRSRSNFTDDPIVATAAANRKRQTTSADAFRPQRIPGLFNTFNPVESGISNSFNRFRSQYR
jgi:hypothetical protein